jgi:LysM repeat protein
VRTPFQFLIVLFSSTVLLISIFGSIALAFIEADSSGILDFSDPSQIEQRVYEVLLRQASGFLDDEEISATSTNRPTTQLSCPPPAGWVLIRVNTADTLQSLSAIYHVPETDLIRANCLLTGSLIPGSTLYVPESLTIALTDTATLVPVTRPPRKTVPSCGPPSGWVAYKVQTGDTLYRLSRLLNVSVAQLQQANCLGSSTIIRVGQSLWVPFMPPTSTATTGVLPTSASPTATLSSTPTMTPSLTASSSATLTLTPSLSLTLVPTYTNTPEPTYTNTPVPTFTNTPVTPSPTPLPAESPNQEANLTADKGKP